MKTTTILAAASFALTGVIALVTGRADAADGVAVWEGLGTAYGPQGAAVGTFSISLTRKQAGGSVRIDGKATLADGQEVPFWEEQESANDGTSKYRIRSNTGSGAGGCFANAICQSYRQSEDGHATATTIAVDSADKVRLQWTEYDHQQRRFTT